MIPISASITQLMQSVYPQRPNYVFTIDSVVNKTYIIEYSAYSLWPKTSREKLDSPVIIITACGA
jgi:hypothetical protein